VLPHRFARVRACLYASPYEACRLRAIARARPRGESPRSCRAQGDASDRLPALRTTDSNARTRRLPARSLGVRRLFGAVVPVTLVPRLAPRAHPRDVAVARRPLARRRRAVHRAARGRSMPMRPGRLAFHDAVLTAPPADLRRPACSSGRPNRGEETGVSVASFASARRGRFRDRREVPKAAKTDSAVAS